MQGDVGYANVANTLVLGLFGMRAVCAQLKLGQDSFTLELDLLGIKNQPLKSQGCRVTVVIKLRKLFDLNMV